jgi:hypothetical protein
VGAAAAVSGGGVVAGAQHVAAQPDAEGAAVERHRHGARVAFRALRSRRQSRARASLPRGGGGTSHNVFLQSKH